MAGADMTGDVVWHSGEVGRPLRHKISGGPGVTIWMTGLSGSGKSTIAHAVEASLVKDGRLAYVLDGDNLRHGLNSDLRFSPTDREENVRRVAEVARLMADAGLVTLVPVISPYRRDRERARLLHQEVDLPFFEVFVDTPLELCEARDPKGLYRRARNGDLVGLTGVDAPYEPPSRPDLVISTASSTVEEADRLVRRLVSG